MKVFGKKKRLREQNEGLKNEITLIMTEAVKNGDHLREKPFIPEDLDFQETVDEGKDDDVTTRIYTRDNFNLSRLIDNQWILLKPNGEKHVFTIDNLLEAITLLRCSGMPISVYGYMNDGPTMADMVAKEFDIIVIDAEKEALKEIQEEISNEQTD